MFGEPPRLSRAAPTPDRPARLRAQTRRLQEGKFGPQILEHAKTKGVTRLALKALAHTSWPGREHDAWRKCWYKPIDDPELAEKAVRFTLSEDVTAAIPPGEEKLFRMALDFGGRFRPLAPKEREDLLTAARGLKPIFRA